MIIPAGTPETSLLRGLFLGLSTLGESNLGPGGSLIREIRSEILGRTLGVAVTRCDSCLTFFSFFITLHFRVSLVGAMFSPFYGQNSSRLWCGVRCWEGIEASPGKTSGMSWGSYSRVLTTPTPLIWIS